MKRYDLILMVVTWLSVTAVGAQSQTDQVAIGDLEALVGQWMDLRSAMAEEKRQWLRRQEQWDLEILLLEEEKAQLEKERDAFNRSAASIEKDRLALLERKEAMEAVTDELSSLTDRAQECLRAWDQWVPESLTPQRTELFQDADKGSSRSLAERVQSLIAGYGQIETLQAGLHTTHEVLDTGSGPRRQVDVLYLGLARAFAVSPDNQWAGVGIPQEDGWTWTSCPGLASDVRLALQVFERQKTAALVELPIRAVDPVVLTRVPQKGGTVQ